MVDPDYSWYHTEQTHFWWKFCRKERCHSQFGSVIEPDPEASEHSRLSKHSCSTNCRLKPKNHTRFERCEREKLPRQTFRFTNLIYYNSTAQRHTDVIQLSPLKCKIWSWSLMSSSRCYHRQKWLTGIILCPPCERWHHRYSRITYNNMCFGEKMVLIATIWHNETHTKRKPWGDFTMTVAGRAETLFWDDVRGKCAVIWRSEVLRCGSSVLLKKEHEHYFNLSALLSSPAAVNLKFCGRRLWLLTSRFRSISDKSHRGEQNPDI